MNRWEMVSYHFLPEKYDWPNFWETRDIIAGKAVKVAPVLPKNFILGETLKAQHSYAYQQP